MTVHSPSGQSPEEFGVHHKNKGPNGFANNEIPFTEIRTYNINMVGDGLNEALANYMYGNGLDRPVHKWFKGKEVPTTTVEETLITDHLIKPDASRIYSDHARLIWIGPQAVRTEEDRYSKQLVRKDLQAQTCRSGFSHGTAALGIQT